MFNRLFGSKLSANTRNYDWIENTDLPNSKNFKKPRSSGAPNPFYKKQYSGIEYDLVEYKSCDCAREDLGFYGECIRTHPSFYCYDNRENPANLPPVKETILKVGGWGQDQGRGSTRGKTCGILNLDVFTNMTIDERMNFYDQYVEKSPENERLFITGLFS